MKYIILIYLFFSPLAASTMSINTDSATVRLIHNTMEQAIRQAMALYDCVNSNRSVMPRSFDASSDSLILCPIKWWASGFFPGTMWYLYEYSGRDDIRKAAEELTDRMSGEELRTDHHDVGFEINCSYGNGYRILHKEKYRNKLITGAASLISRFDPKIGCLRSWNTKKWGYTVIIDNMMNLELLTVAAHLSGDNKYLDTAVSHADVTMKNHFRTDGSSYHVVGYDNDSGEASFHGTHQGWSDESSWSRGQAWGFYGYVMMYRQTNYKRYLDMAIKIGKYLLNHPSMPSDKIPYWDLNAPDIPSAPRDASAGAIMASAYIELASMVGGEIGAEFLKMAESQLKSLCSSKYLAPIGTNGNFILKHSTGHYKAGIDVDAPLAYADYYFVEAMLRYLRFSNKCSITDNTGPATDNDDRELWISSLDRIVRPVLYSLSNEKLKESMPVESRDRVETRKRCTYLEALGRVVVGIAPWLSLGEDQSPEGRLRKEYINMTVKAIENAVNPHSPDYLNFTEGRQPLVDAAFLAQGLLRAPILIQQLNPKVKANLTYALKSTRSIKPVESNWLLFPAIIEVAIKEIDGDWDFSRIEYALDRFSKWYVGDGHYGDGEDFHMDYYNSFVIQPMLMTILDAIRHYNFPDRGFYERQIKIYSRYAAILERFISPEGTYPVIGRSMAYRFGAFHALSDAAYRHMLPDNLSPAAVRSALTAIIRRQMNAPDTFDDFGWLHVGFFGHQTSIGELYISTGSLYLCTTCFVALGLPPHDPFWTSPFEMWTSMKAWSGNDIKNDKFLKLN